MKLKLKKTYFNIYHIYQTGRIFVIYSFKFFKKTHYEDKS